jgi:integrase/recombinase XerD
MKTNQVEIILSEENVQAPVYVFLASKRGSTAKTYFYDLNAVARKLGALDAYSFPWQKLRFQDIVMIRGWLLQEFSSDYAFTVMSAIRGLLETCNDMELLPADQYVKMAKACKVKRDEKPKQAAGRMLKPEEITSLLKTCLVGPRNRAIRDSAIIMLLVGCGLRRDEITKLEYKEYNQETGQLLVHGKGRKTRTNYLTNGIKTAMEAWLKIRGDQDGPLFTVIVRSDVILNRQMEKMSIWLMLKERANNAGIPYFVPHDLRRTFISNMLPLADLATVANLVGHASPDVTAGYDRRGEERKIEASKLLHIPFEERGEL